MTNATPQRKRVTSHLVPFVLVLAAAALALQVRPAAAQTGGRGQGVFTPRATTTLGHLAPVPASYDWPVKPFDRQHPVRAYLDDPRIGLKEHNFHFGIDISAPDGTPVYAVAAGEVWRNSARALAVVVGPSHAFGYWHVVPVVANHQRVERHQLLGFIDKGWEHVHFAERLNGVYLNPLRAGGLGPYEDATAPSISRIAVQPAPGGRLTFVAEAYDAPPLTVPGVWTGLPVTPVLIRWRIARGGAAPTAWQVAADFRGRMFAARLFGSVYTPETRQNHKGKPGRFSFYLARSVAAVDGSYELEVQAFDTRDNRADARIDFRVEDGAVRS